MIRKILILFTITLTSISVYAINAKNFYRQDTVKTVDFVDLEKYTGKWYEIARYPNKFQKQCVKNVTATYKLKDDKDLEVVNECVKKNGKTDKATGEGKIVDKESNAKLEVRFAPGYLSFLPQVWGDYWIIDLEENYQYAVVGDPDREYLWVLSRTPKMDSETYKTIQEKVKKMGFNPHKLIKTLQTSEEIKADEK